MKQRIFISVAHDFEVSKKEKVFKWAEVRYLESQGFVPELFSSEQPIADSILIQQSWSLTNLEMIVQRCSGAIILGLEKNDGSFRTERQQIDGLEVIRSGIPFVIIADKYVPGRGMFSNDNGYQIHRVKNLNWRISGENSTIDPKLRNLIEHFKSKVEEQRHIFIGYCSLAENLFTKLTALLKVNGIKSINYKTDFSPSSTILEQIQEASRKSILGIFLFTKDDMKYDGEYLPRDNVLFEAGFFTHAKGINRVLIIKEEGAKMPEDLAGLIYINVKDTTNIDYEAQEKLLSFVMNQI